MSVLTQSKNQSVCLKTLRGIENQETTHIQEMLAVGGHREGREIQVLSLGPEWEKLVLTLAVGSQNPFILIQLWLCLKKLKRKKKTKTHKQTKIRKKKQINKN